MKKTREAQFFYTEDTGLYSASFPDIAVAYSCVKCHNEHEQSPKSDWKMHDVMGATTWSYPSETVAFDEAIGIIAALRKGFMDAYSGYLQKTSSFSHRPEIGEKWPREGYYLPSLEVFMDKVVSLASRQTLNEILAVLPSETSTQATSFSEHRFDEAGLPIRRSDQNG